MTRTIISLILAVCSFAGFVPCVSALQPGEEAPSFKLRAHDGREISLADYKGTVVVLEWFNQGCPFVKNHYARGNMQRLQTDYAKRGVVWLSITSTNPQHKDFLKESKAAGVYAEHKSAAAALLLDPQGTAGKAYGAKTTPHLFVIGKDGKLAYQGAIDDRPDPTADPAEAKSYLSAALDELLAGQPVSLPQTKPYGCSVKYME